MTIARRSPWQKDLGANLHQGQPQLDQQFAERHLSVGRFLPRALERGSVRKLVVKRHDGSPRD
jgi:hypothetical protein